MIRHIVMYKLKDNCAANKKELERMFRSMRGQIDEIRGLEVGINITEEQRAYDVVLVMTFDNMEDFEYYKGSPYHKEYVKPYVHSVISDSKCVDYTF
ncbi:MAG: Dabb family protein [Clostridia bacterium]|nr:Dabb family protein [Clostridia bacterium]